LNFKLNKKIKQGGKATMVRQAQRLKKRLFYELLARRISNYCLALANDRLLAEAIKYASQVKSLGPDVIRGAKEQGIFFCGFSVERLTRGVLADFKRSKKETDALVNFIDELNKEFDFREVAASQAADMIKDEGLTIKTLAKALVMLAPLISRERKLRKKAVKDVMTALNSL
jgi:hypothetical protein